MRPESNSADPSGGVLARLPRVDERFRALEAMIWDGRCDPALLEVCRVRIADLHGCASELAVQRADIGSKRRAIADWPSAPEFSARDRVLLRFAEQFVLDPHGVTDADAAAVTEVLSPAEVAVFTTAIATFDAVCRLTLALAP